MSPQQCGSFVLLTADDRLLWCLSRLHRKPIISIGLQPMLPALFPLCLSLFFVAPPSSSKFSAVLRLARAAHKIFRGALLLLFSSSSSSSSSCTITSSSSCLGLAARLLRFSAANQLRERVTTSNASCNWVNLVQFSSVQFSSALWTRLYTVLLSLFLCAVLVNSRQAAAPTLSFDDDTSC